MRVDVMEKNSNTTQRSIYEETALQCNSAKDEVINLRRELELNRDFIEWLFDHSEHCDHISFSEAWDEFEKYEQSDITPPAPGKN